MARAARRVAIELGLLVAPLRSGVWFRLLCFQPEPVPRSLPARSPHPSPERLLRPLVSLRGAHHTTLRSFCKHTTLRRVRQLPRVNAWNLRRKLDAASSFSNGHETSTLPLPRVQKAIEVSPRDNLQRKRSRTAARSWRIVGWADESKI